MVASLPLFLNFSEQLTNEMTSVKLLSNERAKPFSSFSSYVKCSVSLTLFLMKPIIVKVVYFSAAAGAAYGGYKFGTKLRNDTDKRRAMFEDVDTINSSSNSNKNLDEDIKKLREEIEALEQERLKLQLVKDKDGSR